MLPCDDWGDNVARDLTALFAGLRARQLMLRLDGNIQNWEDFKTGAHGKFAVGALTKLLRIAALFRYIRRLNLFAKSSR